MRESNEKENIFLKLFLEGFVVSGEGAAINIQDIRIVHHVFARPGFSDRGEIVKRERDRGGGL